MSTKFSTEDRLNILGKSAQYDVCCPSTVSRRKKSDIARNAQFNSMIYPAWTSDGRCIPLLKVLQTNHCQNDCAYCINRASNEVGRTAFTPSELADLTVNLHKRGYIQGLFLSSGIVRSPEHTMELMLQTVRKLRNEYRFKKYIHLKIMPNAPIELVDEAAKLADRVSINIELPTLDSLALLAPQKTKDSILKPMRRVSEMIEANESERKVFNNAPKIAPSGQTTQLIIGATPEPDFKILKLSDYFYKKMKLRRVYYSAFERVNDDARLPDIESPPFLREHRLYQADWLVRVYGFSVNEILSDENPNLDDEFDPKLIWALNNLHFFPIEVNRADYEILIRTPGIGIKSAKRIIKTRKIKSLDLDDLKKLGAVVKRAKYFLTSNGKYLGDEKLDVEPIKKSLAKAYKKRSIYQPSLFDAPAPEEIASVTVGEF